ncbi:MAG: DEAD/DEAH box helicase [Labilithrix sp.]
MALAFDETRCTLLDQAHGRFGEVPEALIVEHVLVVTHGADFPVREAALEALERRWNSAEREELAVASSPPKSVLGSYTTAARKQRADGTRARRDARPYTTTLTSISPITASCDCADFVRGGLGVCKHVLVVLAHVHASPRRLASAHKEAVARVVSRRSRLDWDAVLPLRGELDRVASMRLSLGPSSPTTGHEWSRVMRALRRGSFVESVRQDPERRREVLAALQSLLRGGLDASPAARVVVREELERADRRFAAAAAVPDALASLRTLKRCLYPYQREGVARFLTAGRLLLADDMGLGKTTQAIAACHALFATKRVKRGLLIVPASLKSQWLREWNETTDVPCAVVDGTPDERKRIYRKLEEGFLILNYEQLLRDVHRVQAIGADIVVLDEAQRIKNYASKSAVYVKALQPAYRLVLTGTPMENRLEELASILDWIDDVALSPKWRLVPWYTQWDGDGAGGKVGARNLDTLRRRLEPCLVRRVRKDVLAQLPSRTDTRVPVEMTAQQAGEHDELVPPISQLVQISKKRPLRQPEFLRLMQLLTRQRMIANGLGQLRFEELWPTYSHARPEPTLLEGLFSPKLLELRRLVRDLVVDQGRKVVVFSQWRRMLRLAEWSIRDVLGDAGHRAVFFTGAEKASQRTKSIVDLHDDPAVRVMFLSDAGGVGLNLQKAASACINLELPWNPAVLEQRIGRIYRLGQKLPIDVYNLVSEASIEGRIAGLVGAKQALFSGLFDGTSDELRFDAAASFLTRVERLVEKEPAAAPNPTELVVEVAASESASSDAELSDDVPPPPPPPNPIASLFDVVRVERTPAGAVRIEAPPEAAESLLALFEGMTKLLAGARAPS